MRKPIALVAIVAAAAAASGCSTISNSLGMTKNVPDEFRVVTRAPLTLPPDYSLRPPRPGEPRPQELEPDAEARAALFGQDVGQSASAGERAFVAAAGAEAADPNVRSTVDYESDGVVRRPEALADRVNQFEGQDAAQQPAADAQAEQRRVEEQEAIRRATGGGDVTIRREGGGFKLPGT
jgi:hypothetical protein